MCLWISSVIVELCVVYSHSHLLELSLQHFSLLVKTLINIAHQTLCLSSRDVHGVWIVLGLLILTWAVVVIYTLVQVMNLRRSHICHTIAHLNWGELWCWALPWILAHLRLVFRGCTAIFKCKSSAKYTHLILLRLRTVLTTRESKKTSSSP